MILSLYLRLIVVLILLALSLPTVATAANEGTPYQLAEEFIVELIEKAGEPKTTSSEKRDLLSAAVSFAKTYSDLRGDDAFYKEIKSLVKSVPDTSKPEDDQIITGSDDPELYNKLLVIQRRANHLRNTLEGFVTGLIEKTLNNDIPGQEKDELLKIATLFSKTYSDIGGDTLFYRKTKNVIDILPPKAFSNDEEIIFAFQEALLRDNNLVMEYLVKKVQVRIEPFINDIVNEATSPLTSINEKNRLLRTAMNFAKTYADMSGDHALHKSIHKKTFTARLTSPIRSNAVNGAHTINAPVATRTEKNVFTPDNILISPGDTVRWINHDKVTHVMGSLDFISDGHFFAPQITPNGSFEHTFSGPGEYYYICYIHRSMIGKITVEE